MLKKEKQYPKQQYGLEGDACMKAAKATRFDAEGNEIIAKTAAELNLVNN